MTYGFRTLTVYCVFEGVHLIGIYDNEAEAHARAGDDPKMSVMEWEVE